MVEHLDGLATAITTTLICNVSSNYEKGLYLWDEKCQSDSDFDRNVQLIPGVDGGTQFHLSSLIALRENSSSQEIAYCGIPGKTKTING